ncbi:MAG: hypothetical protein AB4038_05085 [Prochloraceae cyanobacterium]
MRASKPELLAGLDIWLRLGLISEEQVKQLARRYLCCPWREPLPEIVNTDSIAPEANFTSEEVLAQQKIETTKQPNFLSQVWQAFKDELSVRWLLFLGTFLVIVSSVLLADSLWQRVPAEVQYGIFWTYTLTFWGIVFWAF